MSGKKELQSCLKIYFVFLFVFQKIFLISAQNRNPYSHTEVMDREGKYVLEWRVNFEEERIYFNVTVETRGYVGFGLSRKGKMAGADIFIGGVLPNGQPYFKDYYAIGNQRPVVDTIQDWTLHLASESRTHTFLSFSRRLETCDSDHDLPINEDVLALLWCYGERDAIEYHYQNRGSFNAYLLDADLTPRAIHEMHYRNVSVPPRVNQNQLGNLKVWSLSFSEEMPTQDTTYYCSFHKTPSHPRKQHIVGMRTVLNSAVERRHIHHFILHKCYPPSGIDADSYFGGFVGRRDECYVHLHPSNRIPTHYCLEIKHEWAVGGSPVFFPDHVGLPFTETENEYYMFQVHYDNPQGLSNVRLDYALEVYYAERLREHDAGVNLIGANIGLPVPLPPLVMIPPSELAHDVYGLCPSECTQKMYPRGGINVFLARSHTHLAGRRARFLQIQNGRELPIIVDDNFDFNFQTYRLLRRERRINPGDAIGHWCTYETADRDGNATVKSYATQDEMCHGFIWFYPYVRNTGTFAICGSDIRLPSYAQFLQINTTTWSPERRLDIVTSPPVNAGLSTQEVGTRINWTAARRAELQAMHRNLPQVGVCVSADPETITQEVATEVARREGTAPPPTVIITPAGPIFRPDSEFPGQWPANVIAYQKPTRCPRQFKFF